MADFELTIKDINSQWSTSLDMSSLSNDMTVGKLKEIIHKNDQKYSIDRQNLIFAGVILNRDEIELKNLVPNNQRAVIHLFLSPNGEGKVKSNESCEESISLARSVAIDLRSLQAASEFLSKTPADSTKIRRLEKIYNILQEVKIADTTNRQSPIDNSSESVNLDPAPEPAAAPAPAAPQLAPIVWINLGMLFRLSVSAAFIIYAKNISHRLDLISYLSVTMILFYLVHIGAVYRGFLYVANYLKWAPQNEAIPRGAAVAHNGNQNGNNHNNHIGNPPPGAGAGAGEGRGGLLGLLMQLSQHGVTIPTSPGLLYDLFSVFAAIFCSLSPQWKPVALAVQGM